MGKITGFQKIGYLTWVAGKFKDIKDAVDLYEKATNPDTKEQAAYEIATKIAETAAIGIPLWFLDKALTKTGLDRVFDSLKKNKSFEAYLRDQAAAGNMRDFLLGNLAEWGLKELREWMSMNAVLDPFFDLANDIGRFAAGWAERFRDFRIWDPIVLDLNGDGIKTVGTDSGAMFDPDIEAMKLYMRFDQYTDLYELNMSNHFQYMNHLCFN